MTPKQQKLYWREWSAARKADPAADRHALHAQALGHDQSHKDFSNRDLDKVLAQFRAKSRPDDLSAQIRPHVQPRRRLLYKIAELQTELAALGIDPAPYLAVLLQSRFHRDPIDHLSDHDLHHLIMTLAARLSAKRRQPASVAPEPAEALEPNQPF